MYFDWIHLSPESPPPPYPYNSLCIYVPLCHRLSPSLSASVSPTPSLPSPVPVSQLLLSMGLVECDQYTGIIPLKKTSFPHSNSNQMPIPLQLEVDLNAHHPFWIMKFHWLDLGQVLCMLSQPLHICMHSSPIIFGNHDFLEDIYNLWFFWSFCPLFYTDP